FSSSGSHSCTSLIQFKDSFSITEDASFSCDRITGLKSYPKTNSRKQGTACCLWDGVTCDQINAHVIALDLSCSWLYGNFPCNTTLFLLPHLQKLNLAFNDFNLSKIPSEFGRFESLVYLNLSHTSFVGEVPSQVSHLSKLVSLDLSSWIYDSAIDKHALEGLVQNLTEVRLLFLDGINMSSTNPHVFMNLSSSLRSLSLDFCDLQGKFPKNIFDLPNLNLLDLKFNRSNNLEHLDLSWMSFSTKLIDSVDNLQALKYLDLSGNSFFQELSVSITNLSSLEYLSIRGANICGGLPDSIGNLVSLKFLDLSISNLSGPVPRSLGNLLQLTHLDLGWNKLSGQIPLSILNLTQLEYLGIATNSLEGSIPDEVTAFPSLITSRLYDNLLNGTLPSWLYTAPSLKIINLSQNQFNGPLPSSIFQLLNLTHLFLSSNNLSGVMELSMFSSLPNLKYLDLSYNSLSLTSNSTSSVNLTSLFLSSCNLSEFPQFLKGLKSLESLDLSYNRIEVGNLTSLEWLDLSSNRLSGTIPNKLADLPFLSSLNVSENQLHGQITQGKQFNTFGNDSYEGNKGLCGFSVSKGCKIIEPAPPNVLEKNGSKSNIAFG
ncbi:hypothetical protein ES319_A04G008000v1, partial [Gossypium barbadense]